MAGSTSRHISTRVSTSSPVVDVVVPSMRRQLSDPAVRIQSCCVTDNSSPECRAVARFGLASSVAAPAMPLSTAGHQWDGR